MPRYRISPLVSASISFRFWTITSLVNGALILASAMKSMLYQSFFEIDEHEREADINQLF
jgi:hypothetical protein